VTARYLAVIDHPGGVTPESTYLDGYKLLEGILLKPIGLSIKSGLSVYNDSDGIHDNVWDWSLERSVVADHKIVIDVAQYASSAPKGSVFTGNRIQAYLSNFRVGGQVRLAPAVYLTLLGGGSYLGTGGALRPVFNFQITASPVDRWTFDLSAGREFLGVTPRAIDRSIASTSVAGTVQLAVDSRTFLSVRADRRYWSDANRSIASETTLRKILHYNKRFFVDAGLLSHGGPLLFPQLGLHRVIDLGVWWHEQTGMPLPLGGNAVRRALGLEIGRAIAKTIRDSVEYGLEHREEALNYAMQFARDMETELADKFISMYVNRWTLGYGELGKRALTELIARGTAAGLLPGPATVEFLSEE